MRATDSVVRTDVLATLEGFRIGIDMCVLDGLATEDVDELLKFVIDESVLIERRGRSWNRDLVGNDPRVQ